MDHQVKEDFENANIDQEGYSGHEVESNRSNLFHSHFFGFPKKDDGHTHAAIDNLQEPKDSNEKLVKTSGSTVWLSNVYLDMFHD